MRLGSERSERIAIFERIARALGLGACLATTVPAAAADSTVVDPSYGRVDGDLGVVVGLGAVVAPRGARAGAELRLRYLESSGVFVTYEEAALFGSPAEPPRVLGAGLEIRPLFLFRWLQGHELQRARLDLAIDSLGLELGAIFEQPSGAGTEWRRGIEVGLGVEVPLLEATRGPWVHLRAALRWSDAELASGVVRDADDRQVVLSVGLAWHELFATHLVDVGDRAPR